VVNPCFGREFLKKIIESQPDAGLQIDLRLPAQRQFIIALTLSNPANSATPIGCQTHTGLWL